MTLSDKMTWMVEKPDGTKEIDVFYKEDVKASIKKIIENPSIINGTKYVRVSEIIKEAGDKLI